MMREKILADRGCTGENFANAVKTETLEKQRTQIVKPFSNILFCFYPPALGQILNNF